MHAGLDLLTMWESLNLNKKPTMQFKIIENRLIECVDLNQGPINISHEK